MEKEMNITFEGVKLEIRKMERPELKGIYAKDILGFDFYEAKYKDNKTRPHTDGFWRNNAKCL